MMWDRTTTSRRFCFFFLEFDFSGLSVPFARRGSQNSFVSYCIDVCMYVCIWFVPCNNSITNNAFFMVN